MCTASVRPEENSPSATCGAVLLIEQPLLPPTIRPMAQE